MLSTKTPLQLDIGIPNAVFTPHTEKRVARLGNPMFNWAVNAAFTAKEVGL